MTEPALLAQRVVYAGLDAIGSVLLADLLACLHGVEGGTPQLYLRSPSLASLTSTDAFALFSDLRDLMKAHEVPGPVKLPGFTAYAYATGTPPTQALWIVGRRDRGLDVPEEGIVCSLADAIGGVVDALDEAARAGTTPTGPVTVTVETDGDVSHAEVWVPTVEGARAARAEAASSMTAVARATLAAVDGNFRLGHAADDLIDGERAVIVVARDPLGRVAVGASLCDTDPLQATARAALEAARSLAT